MAPMTTLPESPAPPRRHHRRLLAAALLLGLLTPLGWWLFGPHGVAVEIAAKTWQRDIEIERLLLESASAWCDELPADAQDISRRLLQDPEGRRGLATHCRYQAPQWRARRSARAAGQDLTPPRWPDEPVLELGSERLGKRHEHYALELQSADGRAWRCELPQARWQQFRGGQRLRLAVDRHGVADCSSLPQAQP